MANCKEIIEIFLENTGKHMLDSGEENKRLWQINQARGRAAIEAENDLTIVLPSEYYVEHSEEARRVTGKVRYPIYRGLLEDVYLSDRDLTLTPIPDLMERISKISVDDVIENQEKEPYIIQGSDIELHQSTYQTLVEIAGLEVSKYDQIIKDAWAEELKKNPEQENGVLELCDFAAKFLYGEGVRADRQNTYNTDTYLTQEFILTVFKKDDDLYFETGEGVLGGQGATLSQDAIVGVELHQGADIRGGYTDIYFLDADPEEAILFRNPIVEKWSYNGKEFVCEDWEELPVCNNMLSRETVCIPEEPDLFGEACRETVERDKDLIYFPQEKVLVDRKGFYYTIRL